MVVISVLVFQDGAGASVLGYTSTGFIQVYLPLTVFALLFGLSTDYEVFLIGRMRESWLRTGDNTTAVWNWWLPGQAHPCGPRRTEQRRTGVSSDD